MPAPLIFLTFANDADRHLSLLKEESRRLFAALESSDREGFVKIHREESAQIEDIFQILTRNPNQVVIFHYGGHAGGTHLDLEGKSAKAPGLASLLGQQKSLQLVFLNGCSTYDQVQGLLDAGVKAVIATSVSIEDRKAMDFATQFYEGLAHNHSIGEAFKLATAYLHTSHGNEISVSMRDRIAASKETKNSKEIEWGLYLNPTEREEVLNYRLPDQKMEASAPPTKQKRVSSWLLPLVGLLLILGLTVAGINFWQNSQPMQLTVFVTDEKGNVALENTGRLNIPLGNRSLNEVIGSNGRTNFPDITADNKGDTILIGLDAEGWELAEGQNRFVFTGEPIQLIVQRDQRIGLIKGIVKSWDEREFISGALVRINMDTTIMTDTMGFFNISLPEHMWVEKITDSYTLTVSKEGYIPNKKDFKPTSPDSEIKLKRLDEEKDSTP